MMGGARLSDGSKHLTSTVVGYRSAATATFVPGAGTIARAAWANKIDPPCLDGNVLTVRVAAMGDTGW